MDMVRRRRKMVSKLVSKMKGVCSRTPTEAEIGWYAITVGGLMAGISIYAFSQTRELTAPIVAGFLMALLILVGSQFRSRLKELEDKVEKLSKKD